MVLRMKSFFKMILLFSWGFFALLVMLTYQNRARSQGPSHRIHTVKNGTQMKPQTHHASVGLKGSCLVEEDVCLLRERNASYLWYHIRTFEYAINKQCEGKEKSPYLLVLVISDPRDPKTRSMYRQTCGSVKAHMGKSIKTMFFVGKTNDSLVENAIIKESEQYGDIIKIDFEDSYKNYTLKTLLAFRWAVDYCPGAEFVFRCGHDVITNMREIVGYLTRLPPSMRATLFSGFLFTRPGRPHRDPNSKFYQSHEQYGPSTYPPFISGFASIFSLGAIKILNSASLNQHLFIEDVYLASLAHKHGIKLINTGRYFWFMPDIKYEDILRNKCGLLQSFAIHRPPTLAVWKILNGNLTKEKACKSSIHYKSTKKGQ
ncbi:beta-1,3-galactosyltransferase 1 [Lingula anatina]|uniref:Hexosyltransferase n=1 Tax=Lingula anatina TaxID=7574 RepID=A0A1S3H404_LINAN|nr:beta-1,3-galactosyltransferase 1 [Lingula anatina]|eukprot:XP_013379869.1 beta-1,3-galactosyltransferase 1 [Lingula anatina]